MKLVVPATAATAGTHNRLASARTNRRRESIRLSMGSRSLRDVVLAADAAAAKPHLDPIAGLDRQTGQADSRSRWRMGNVLILSLWTDARSRS
jgi:hypothetical protein